MHTKVKHLIITSVILFTHLGSFSQQPDQLIYPNVESIELSELPLETFATEFTEIINELQVLDQTAYDLSGNPVADSCVVLMNKNQIQGPIGLYINQVFTTHAAKLPHLIQGGSLTSMCPKYSSLSLLQKSQLWTLILASMAHFESSCVQTASAKGPNGTAYGFYQLHKGKEHLYDGAAKLCVKNAGGHPKLASKCTLSMLEKQFNVNNGILFSNKSYWDVLRPNGSSKKSSLIKAALMKSSLCRGKYL